MKHLPSAREANGRRLLSREPTEGCLGRQSGSAAASSALWLHSNHPDGHEFEFFSFGDNEEVAPFHSEAATTHSKFEKEINWP